MRIAKMTHFSRAFRAFLSGLAVIVGAASLAPVTPAVAAAITYNDPYCSQFFTVPGGQPGDVILRCVKAMACAIAPVGSSYIVPPGTTVTLQATCTAPAAQSYSWSTGILSPQGCPQPTPVAGDPTKVTVMSTTARTCWYEVVGADTVQAPANNQGLARYGIAWADPAPAGCTASVGPSSLPTTGGSVTLNASCTSGPVTAWSWTRNGAAFSNLQNPTDNLPANTTGAPITYAYVMTACNGPSCAAPVAASGSPVTVAGGAVPSGCTITPTPTGGNVPSSGGNISMAVSCTAGSPFTQFNWRKNGATFGTNAANQGDTLAANAAASPVTYTYDVQVCNSAGCAARVTQIFTVAGTVSAGGLCSQYTNVIQADLPWNQTPDYITTPPLGGFMADGVFVGRLVVPAGASSASVLGQISVAEFSGSPIFRTATISTQACDFRGYPSSFPTDPTGVTAPLKWSGGNTVNFSYSISPDARGAPMLLAPGTYYLNVRTEDFYGNLQCPSSACDIIVHNVSPH